MDKEPKAYGAGTTFDEMIDYAKKMNNLDEKVANYVLDALKEECEKKADEILDPLKEKFYKALDELHCVAYGMKAYDNNTIEAEKVIDAAINEYKQMLKEFNANNYQEWQDSVDMSNMLYGKLKAILLIILLAEVNIHNFKKYIISQDWTYEQYVQEETDPNTNGHQFAYSMLSRAEFDCLKENIMIICKDE